MSLNLRKINPNLLLTFGSLIALIFIIERLKIPGLSKPVGQAAESIRGLGRKIADVINRFKFRDFQGPVPVSRKEIDQMMRIESLYGMTIDRFSREAGVNPSVVTALIFTESGGNPETVGPRGEVGLMQITPQAWQEVSDLPFVPFAKDPVANIRVGTQFLRKILDQWDNNLIMALQAWNCCGTNKERLIENPNLSRNFAIKVLNRAKALDKILST